METTPKPECLVDRLRDGYQALALHFKDGVTPAAVLCFKVAPARENPAALSFLLVPLWFLRRRPALRNLWAMLALVVALATLPATIGCGSGSGGSTTTLPTTHQVTCSAELTLVVK